MLDIDDPFAGASGCSKKGLRQCQYETITNLEAGFRIGHKKAHSALPPVPEKPIPHAWRHIAPSLE